jgi:hypothetical protein
MKQRHDPMCRRVTASIATGPGAPVLEAIAKGRTVQFSLDADVHA